MNTIANNVHIIARIRPLLNDEVENDIVVRAEGTAITIPNPKNQRENFTFPFNAVHDMGSDQKQLFAEVSSTINHLFKGNDVTIFAYGATGSGKTYTMRGQKAATDRGIIPRLLTAIYRRGKELERQSKENTMAATMSYFEVYNDKVFDLFIAPEKRTPAGLNLRENDGKTVVVGLSEKDISSLKEFEALYDKANNNRSTSATKLNAHSSRSHAIICVRVVITNCETGERRTGTVSCIDLAGSEDNRRTANDKDRMTESASINKSLFVLAQCVEAMIKKQNRIPYRESKMTRILSLGQNNGLTVMILNIAPTKAFHMDSLSALNFANRAKKIDLKQADTDYVTFSGRQQLPAKDPRSFGTTKTNIMRPLAARAPTEGSQKATRAPFNIKPLHKPMSSGIAKSRPISTHLSSQNIADLVAKKVEEILCARALNEQVKPASPDIGDDFNKRIELLEAKLDKKADARHEGLTFILMAKQHMLRGENSSAIKMYQLALTYFPGHKKLLRRISVLKNKISPPNTTTTSQTPEEGVRNRTSIIRQEVHTAEQTFITPPRVIPRKEFAVFTDEDHLDTMDSFDEWEDREDSDYVPPGEVQTPRTIQLLDIVNSEDVKQIMKLKGIGMKRAEALVRHVRELRESQEDADFFGIRDLEELGMIRGISQAMVDNMKSGLEA